ncbi:MAG: PilZ domain-containing protein [Gammaproteobacteria bacterium]
MERRICTRTPSQTKVRLYFNGHGHMEGRLRDFSQGGVFIRLDKKYQMPQAGETIFLLADNMDEPYTMITVRSNNRELALMFSD